MPFLCVFVVVDYITGIMCAVVDKKLSGAVGFKGIFKKVLIFTLVGIANILDVNVIGGGSSDRTHIGFEIWEDGSTYPAYFSALCREAVELCVYLCKQ